MAYVTQVTNQPTLLAEICSLKSINHYKIIIMGKNMGTVDKAIRIVLAIIVVVLYLSNLISGTLAIVLLIFAGIFILTSFLSFCPLYLPFGISTRPKR